MLVNRRQWLLAWAAAATGAVALPRGASWLTEDGRIRIVGYNDMEEMLRPICALFSARHRGIEFALVLTGTKAAPEALANGTSLLAPMGAELMPEQWSEWRRTLIHDPLMIRVAHDSLNPRARSSPTAVFVHRDNPLREISLEQLRDVLTAGFAHLRRWGELGLTGVWADAAIRAHGLADDTAIGTLLRLQKLSGRPYANSVTAHSQSRDVVAALEREPYGIGFANLNHITPLLRALPVSERTGGRAYAGTAANLRAGVYPLDRALLIYLKRDRLGRLNPIAVELTQLILSTQGQRIIASGSLGYIPLSMADATRERAKLG